MRLTIHSPFKSIRSFEPVDIPEFTLITGPNGSGKSHLLSAISSGSILVDGVQRPVRSGSPFTAETFLPSAAEFGSYDLYKGWLPRIKDMAKSIADTKIALHRAMVQNGYDLAEDVLSSLIDCPRDALSMDVSDPDGLYSVFSTELGVHEGRLANLFRQISHFGAVVANISKSCGRGVLNLSADDLEAPIWGVIEDNNQISTVFVNYRDAVLKNRSRAMRAADGEPIVYLAKGQFEARYGEPPWIVVNRVMHQMGLAYRISQPDAYESVPYHPMLISDAAETEVPFSDLSSGEIVLLGLALSSYDRWDRRISSVRSSLLLLDEIDAPLHPAMARNYVSTVVDEIVGRQRVAVIATTHSLATVALAPESAIYVLRNNPHRLEKVSKARALGILSEGVPTLAIDFSGRRQVFCESEYDARAYAAVYDNLRRQIGHERSLDFVATSVSSKLGGIAGGKEVVVSVVGQLESSGNGSVLGLIDWDGHNDPVGRVYVLAKGRRNGLENVLFDPLMLAGLIALRFEALRSKIGLPTTASIGDLKRLDIAHIQGVCDEVQRLVLGESEVAVKEEVAYFGGLKLQVASSYLLLDDHELGDKVLAAFPEFRSISRAQSGGGAHGRLMEEIGRSVARDFVEFLPIELCETLRSLMEADLTQPGPP